MSGALRGNGKVVPRQASATTTTTETGSMARSNAANPSTSDVRASTAHLQGTLPATALPVIGCSTSSNGPAGPSADLSSPLPGHSVVSVTGPACQRQWRCAPYLPLGVPAEVPAHQLGTSSSKKVLGQHQPVLIRHNNLASCRIQEPASNVQNNADHTIRQPLGAETGVSWQGAGGQNQQTRPGSKQQQQLLVLCSPADTNRFIAADLSKNLPGSYYQIRKPETTQLQMTFEEWCDSWRSWEHSRLLLQTLLCTWDVRSNSPGARIWPNTAVWPHVDRLLQMAPTVSSQLPGSATATAGSSPGLSMIDWAQLRQLLSDGQYSSTGQLHLLAGGRNALLPARYETSARLICQVAGRQQLLLLAPGLAFEGMYPYPVAHPYDGYSCVDWEEPELEHWPVAAQVRGLVCELSPGDTLLVPAYWFVHSQLQQPACVALVLELQPLPDKLLSPDALLLQLSRMIECWVGAEVGTANIRQWLMAVSEGREWQQLAKKTTAVSGYKQIKVCHMVLKQLQQLLTLAPLKPPTHQRYQSRTTIADSQDDSDSAGHTTATAPTHKLSTGNALEAEARRFLSRMCDERLMPTYWLNEGITDPLYLKYQPQHHLIREDAQAAKYPMLFRHKLIANRPDWMQHAEQLQLASKQHAKRLTN